MTTDWDALKDFAVHRVNGEKEPASGHKAVATTDNPIPTETALRIFRKGGNAADAAVAAALVQSTNQQYMTNHAGLITALYYDAKTRKAYQLESAGHFPAHLPIHKPNASTWIPGMAAASCIPHGISGLGALHRRFGKLSWSEVCDDAVYWADRGHNVTQLEGRALPLLADVMSFFPETRAHLAPSGRIPMSGEHWRSADLAATMKGLQAEGPGYFSEGEWAEKFVAKANELGWPIAITDMSDVSATWLEPKHWMHNGIEVVQQAPPQVQAAFSGLVLGILGQLGTAGKGHYAHNADAFFDMAHALRWGHLNFGFINDPNQFAGALDVFFDESYHRHAARLIDGARPKVDLTTHVDLTSGPLVRRAGYSPTFPDMKKSISGSCETAFVDADGNWCQMMNTLQGGGMPGVVVGGVAMHGSHSTIGAFDGANGMNSFAGYLSPGARMRMPIGNTLLFRNGEPFMGVGTTGIPHITLPQVLFALLDCGMDPKTATEQPRLNRWDFSDQSVVTEGGIADSVVEGAAARGLRIMQTLPRHWNVGSFSIVERDANSGLLNAYADPRLGGLAAGI